MESREATAAAAGKIAKILWESWVRFYNQSKRKEQTFPWQMLLLALEIVIALSLLVAWTVRLVRKGRALDKSSEEHTRSDEPEEVGERTPMTRREMMNRRLTRGFSLLSYVEEEDKVADDHLLYLAKGLLIARLDHCLVEKRKREKILLEYLEKKHERMKTFYGDDLARVRRQMMLWIRRSLVQHPYDHVGRHMASDTKTILQEQILGDPRSFRNWCQMPLLTKTRWFQKALLLTPLVIASIATINKGLVYCYDMYSDVEVIRELRLNGQNLEIPNITEIPDIRVKAANFVFEDIRMNGTAAIMVPCELLNATHEILVKGLPFYKTVTEVTKTSLNPNMGVESNFSLSDVVSLTESFFLINNAGRKHIAKEIKMQMKKTKEGTKVQVISGEERDWMEGVIQFEEGEKENPMERHKRERMLKAILNFTLGPAFTSIDNETNIAHLMAELRREIVSSEELILPPPREVREDLSESETKCLRVVEKLFLVCKNPVISDFIITYYLDYINVAQGASEKLKFVTINVIESATLLLMFTMAWTILHEARDIISGFLKSRYLPIVTNFKLECHENYSGSLMFKDGNTTNDYVVQSSSRNFLNINQATNETLNAVNIQIALWVFMATFLQDVKTIMEKSFKLDTIEGNRMFGLSDDAFTNFEHSAIMASLLSGIFSLTFAQYKQYMTRHEKDAELDGMVVYWFACMFNSMAIFLTQIPYFAVGLPFFTTLVAVCVRFIVNLDEYDSLPSSDSMMVSFMVLVVVLLPLKLCLLLFARLLKHLTDTWILRPTHHVNLRNRSGYNVPGILISNYMFLPSANNTHDQITSPGSVKDPGFYYFSKDPLSRKLYQLRFEIQIFCKVSMHLFYITMSFVMINMLHLLFEWSTILPSYFWLEILEGKWVSLLVTILTLGTLPLLLLSFGCLHLYYTRFHPWRSEGVSLGFEPNDKEVWRPLIPESRGEASWGIGVWHQHDLQDT